MQQNYPFVWQIQWILNRPSDIKICSGNFLRSKLVCNLLFSNRNQSYQAKTVYLLAATFHFHPRWRVREYRWPWWASKPHLSRPLVRWVGAKHHPLRVKPQWRKLWCEDVNWFVCSCASVRKWNLHTHPQHQHSQPSVCYKPKLIVMHG